MVVSVVVQSFEEANFSSGILKLYATGFPVKSGWPRIPSDGLWLLAAPPLRGEGMRGEDDAAEQDWRPSARPGLQCRRQACSPRAGIWGRRRWECVIYAPVAGHKVIAHPKLTMTIHQVPLLPKLKLNSAGKPAIPKWVAPPETEEDLEWQTLRSLDLSLMDGTPEQQKRCEEMCKDALTNEGFLLLEGHGVDEETVCL